MDSDESVDNVPAVMRGFIAAYVRAAVQRQPRADKANDGRARTVIRKIYFAVLCEKDSAVNDKRLT